MSSTNSSIWRHQLILSQLHTISISFVLIATATTEIYTLSLHDALPISGARHAPARAHRCPRSRDRGGTGPAARPSPPAMCRSEEHTSELQSHVNLVCRLLLEKKK